MGTPSGTKNAVEDASTRNPVKGTVGEQVTCAIMRDLVLSSREQSIEEQRKDPESAVKEARGKFCRIVLGRKLITPFQKLVMVSEGTEFAVGDIEKLFDEARRSTKAKHEKWAKYCNRRRRDVRIRVNEIVSSCRHIP
ncbi:uncharacterized protein TNCV_3697371 [Trichonephila clavipes]|uniref:Uncharacterized protein n=1 Tax=Trichonephila clavipes TaxID=2585209 RepID=A0A8X6SE78_TRICX|nr:uncharacterized protein TNCV_3697371 [Trichonephila clavipes]